MVRHSLGFAPRLDVWLGCLALFVALTVPALAQIPAIEREALIALYESTNGDGWTDKTDWLGDEGTECTWRGVTCSGGNVQQLSLRSNQLSGSLPAELGNLSNLDYLDLGSNQLSGSLPAELGNLTNLWHVYLADNLLSGSIPSQLGNLSHLQDLWLNFNQLSGSLPAELGNLSSLQNLGVHANRLSGSIPAQLGNLSNLQGLYLYANQLSGSLPAELGNLSKLQILWLHANGLSGSIPDSVAALVGVTSLNLGWNALYTTDPGVDAWATARQADWRATQTVAPTDVDALSVSGSSVTVGWTPIAYTADAGYYRVLVSTSPGGPYTPFATTTSNKTASSLVVTGLSGYTTYYFVVDTTTEPHVNNLQNQVRSEYSAEMSAVTTTGPPPPGQREALVAFYNSTNGPGWANSTGWLGPEGTECTWYGVTCSGGNVQQLSLRSNQLSGSMPAELGILTSLEYLDLGSNQLSGSLPAELGNLTNLWHVYLADNLLSGSIPSQLGNLSHLQDLWLNFNQLSGSLPAELGNLSSLQNLGVHANRLSGSIPAQLGNLSNLQGLYLYANQLSGSLPAELGNLSKLQILWLHANGLSGSIPGSVAALVGVTSLNLGWNALYTTDPGVDAWATARQADWKATQTVSPANVEVSSVGGSLVTVGWTPVAYTADAGYYRVLVSTSPGGPYTPFATTTPGKSASSLVVTGLSGYTTYYFVVDTTTEPHANNIQNQVRSECSAEISATTTAPATTISFVSPPTGLTSGGTTVTVSGTGFASGALLRFGGREATGVTVVDSTTITATTPVHHAGAVDVVVTNPDLESATLKGGFTYVAVLGPPRVVVTATPRPMFQAEGSAGATTFWILTNVGESPTTISLSCDASFFSQQPAVFPLTAGESRKIAITAEERSVGSYAGRSLPSGEGVADDLSVTVQLVVYGTPGAAVPDVVPEKLRIDVEGPGPVLSGEVGFRNVGTGPATGVVASEAAWLIPDPGPVTIPPGATVSVGFEVNRAFREDPDSTDSQVTTVRFVYPPTSGVSGKAASGDGGSQPGCPISDTPRLATETQGLGKPGPGQIGLSSPWIRGAATGAGRRVVSDLVVSATSSFESMKLFTLDAGAACSAARAGDFALAAGVSGYLANLGHPGSAERSFDLHLRTGMSRSIARVVQTVDDLRQQLSFLDGVATRSTLGALPGECAFLTGLTAFERTVRLSVQEVAGGDTLVSITLLDAEGSTMQTLGPMAVGTFGSIEQALTLDPRVMTARVMNVGGDGRVVARIEEATSGAEARSAIDDVHVCGPSGSGVFVVPLVGAVGEATGTSVRRRPTRRGGGGSTLVSEGEEGRTESTRLALFSPNGAEVELTLTTFTARRSRSVNLGAGRTLMWSDVLGEVFDVRGPDDGYLTARVVSGKATLAAWREVAGADGDAWNAWLTVIPVDQGLRAGQTRAYYGVWESAVRSRENVPGAVRSSLVLIESAGSPATVSVQIAASGRRSAASPIKTYAMAANEVVTIDDVVTAVLGASREELGDLYNAGVFVTVTAGAGRVVPVIVTRAVRTGDRTIRTW
jgi:Leucine-rich repeat (LRR) protein